MFMLMPPARKPPPYRAPHFLARLLKQLVRIKRSGGETGSIDELRRKMEEQEREYSRRLAGLTRHLIKVQDESRRRFALELHDRTSSNLMAIALNLETIAKSMSARLASTLGGRLADTRALLADTTLAVRDITAELRPSVLDYAGLAAALNQLGRQFMRRTGMSVQVSAGELDTRCGHAMQTSLYYIAQEALTNCAKHACAGSVQIDARYVGNNMTMTIMDDGAGFDPLTLNEPSSKAGLGLLTMAERARAAGGTLDIRSQPGRGTTIRVKIPLDAAGRTDGAIVPAGTAGSSVG